MKASNHINETTFYDISLSLIYMESFTYWIQSLFTILYAVFYCLFFYEVCMGSWPDLAETIQVVTSHGVPCLPIATQQRLTNRLVRGSYAHAPSYVFNLANSCFVKGMILLFWMPTLSYFLRRKVRTVRYSVPVDR